MSNSFSWTFFKWRDLYVFFQFFCFFFFQFPRRWLFLNTTLRPLQRTSSTAVKKRTPFGVEDGTSKIFAMAVSSWYCWYRLAEKHRKNQKKKTNRKSENPLKLSLFFNLSCVENLVWFCSNHMVFRQNLSPLFREHIFFNFFDFLGPKLHKKNNNSTKHLNESQKNRQPSSTCPTRPVGWLFTTPHMPTSVAGG